MSDIAINPVTRRVQFTGNTGTGPYAFTFNILVDGDIAVFKGTTELTLTTDYTVSINANGTGSITLTVALVASDVLTIIGGRELSRTTDFVTAGDLLASSLNEQLDSNVIMTQQLDEKLGRGLFVNPGDVFTDLELPLKDDRKGTVLGFNATTGDPEPGPEIGDVDTIAAISADIKTLAEIQDGTVATDAITNVNTIRANVTTVSGISGNVTTVAGISSDVTTVAADGTDIGNVSGSIANVNTVATNIASVNTNATNIADIQNASTNAATATTQAGIATTKAGEAAASATSAASSATASEAAKDAALAALDNFDDRYLGAKASDPTVDNDGNPLVSGALYFNTTDDVMKVYDGSSWLAAYASLSGALLVSNNLSDLGSASAGRTNLGLGTASTSAATDFVAVTGDSMTGNLSFGDNDKAIFGAGSDLQIYHSGSHSVIKDAGDGNLQLIANDFQLRNGADNANMMTGANGGAITLMHNGSSKLATTSTGVTVTGTLDINTNDAAGNTIDIIGEGATSGSAICTNWTTGSAYLDFRLGGLTTAYTEMRLYSGGDLHVDGNVIAYSTTISDERLKTDIVKIDSALDKVDQINGYTFTYTADGKKSAGVIAQEVEKVLPSAITESTLPLKMGEDDKTEYKTVQYDQLIGLLVEAVKELKAEVAELKGQ